VPPSSSHYLSISSPSSSSSSVTSLSPYLSSFHLPSPAPTITGTPDNLNLTGVMGLFKRVKSTLSKQLKIYSSAVSLSAAFVPSSHTSSHISHPHPRDASVGNRDHSKATQLSNLQDECTQPTSSSYTTNCHEPLGQFTVDAMEIAQPQPLVLALRILHLQLTLLSTGLLITHGSTHFPLLIVHQNMLLQFYTLPLIVHSLPQQLWLPFM